MADETNKYAASASLLGYLFQCRVPLTAFSLVERLYPPNSFPGARPLYRPFWNISALTS
jgi:hypothetical protein